MRFRPELRPEPAGGAYDAHPDPLVGWGGGNGKGVEGVGNGEGVNLYPAD